MIRIQGDMVKNILNNCPGMYVHQVNCQQRAGMGLAKQMRNRIPGWHEDYITVEPEFGSCTFFTAGNNVVIANLYGQLRTGVRTRQTDYAAFRSGLQVVRDEMNNYGIDLDSKVYIPYRIGCGLGGGSWIKIQDIIIKELWEYETIILRRKND